MDGFVRPAVPKLGCTLESTGELLKVLMPGYSSTIKSEYLGLGGRHQDFLKLPGIAECTHKFGNHCIKHFKLM